MRLRFILGLILMGVALQFIAKTLNGVLPMLQEAAQYPVSGQMMAMMAKRPVLPRQPVLPKQTQKNFPAKPVIPTAQFAKAAQRLKKQLKKETSVKLINPSDETQTPPQNNSAFMQITLEDARPPVKNTALGPEASARLEKFLNKKREEHAQLARETAELFNKDAQREVIKALSADERESLANAREAKSAADYAARQEKTDKKTSAALAAIFEKHKKNFNRRLNNNSPAWNSFFNQVNNFQKAAN